MKFILMAMAVIVTLFCGFTIPDVIKPFDVDEYLNKEILLDGTHYYHESFKEVITTGINWQDCSLQLSEHLKTTEYDITIEPFEESWIIKLFDFLF